MGNSWEFIVLYYVALLPYLKICMYGKGKRKQQKMKQGEWEIICNVLDKIVLSKNFINYRMWICEYEHIVSMLRNSKKPSK